MSPWDSMHRDHGTANTGMNILSYTSALGVKTSTMKIVVVPGGF